MSAAGTDQLFADIDDVIPGFGARARVLSTVVTRDDWPPQRAAANGGTTACAETAQLVVDQIGLTFPPGGPA
ncbi:MAG TPA: hypothetical protein VG268_01810 [Streptosporangiaceae bacterium]|nr:hypothetical protein [Streptosporangiaceae bacterium]